MGEFTDAGPGLAPSLHELERRPLMKLKRFITAALVVATLGISAPSAFARHHYRVVRERVVYVGPHRVVRRVVVGPRVVVRRVERRVDGAPRFLPLPAPSFLPVPPPFYRHNLF